MTRHSAAPAILSQSARTSRVASVPVSPSRLISSARSKIDSSNTRSISLRAASFASESAKHSAADMCGLARTIHRGAILTSGTLNSDYLPIHDPRSVHFCEPREIESGAHSPAGKSLDGANEPHSAHTVEGQIHSTVTP